VISAGTTLDRYLDEVVSVLAEAGNLVGAYLIGSAARGSYDPDRSDLDLIAVLDRELTRAEKQALADAVEALDCPARKLELVVYRRGAERHQLNLNTGEYRSFDPDDDPSFWFTLDRAAADAQAVALAGPPWNTVFAPVAPEAVRDAIGVSLEWQEQHDPTGRSSVLNACRAWHWLETGSWVSKHEAASWLRDRVRAAL
jgi:predicted nucleotidyltransferase